MTVATEQRHTRAHPCPVCGGYDAAGRGQGHRCFGFLSDDGAYARCTREEHAGGLALEASTDAYAHRLTGECRCGRQHGPSEASGQIPEASGGHARQRTSAPLGKIVATYDYRDEGGALLFQVVRYTEPKDFRQRRPDGRNGWIWGIEGVRRVLYRLPELAAADPAAPVWIAEGEKDVDRLESLGLVATCNPMGAKKWRAEFGESLRGRPVVVLADNDDEGRAHARQVAEALAGVAAQVRVLELPDLPAGGDVCDWLDRGHVAADLVERARAIEEVPAPPVRPRYELHHASEAFEPLPDERAVVAGVLKRGDVAAVVGAAGTKKTWLLLDLCVHVAANLPWLDRTIERGHVLIIDEESGNRRMRRRLAAVLRAHDLDGEVPIFYTSLAQFDLRDPADVEHVRRLVADLRPVLVVIDAFADCMVGGDENAVKDTQPVMRALRGIAEAYEAAIVVIHHAGKNGQSRGSTAIVAAVDLALMIESKPRSPDIVIRTEKARDYEPFEIALAAEFGEDTFDLVLTGHEPPTKRLSISQDYVFRFLAREGPSTMRVVMDNADQCTPNAARQAVYGLVKEGAVRRVDSGGSGEKATFAVVADGTGPRWAE